MGYIAAVLALSTYTSFSWATLPSRPERCPSTASIKSQDFYRYQGTNNGWIGYKIEPFDTNEQWVFAMGYFSNSNINDANIYLQIVTGTPTPIPSDDLDGWTCEYNVPGSYLGAFAATIPTYSTTHVPLKNSILKVQ